ncbi:MAG: AbrB/MazE/SpoVT family DNA-binding domain-containing protein [Candidatus Saccharimonadales bacterium]
MKTTQNLQKWGNSAGVRIPKKVMDAAHLRLNDPLEIDVQNRSIVLTPTKKQPRKTLDDLLRGVTPAEVGGEYDWNVPVGKEIW